MLLGTVPIFNPYARSSPVLLVTIPVLTESLVRGPESPFRLSLHDRSTGRLTSRPPWQHAPMSGLSRAVVAERLR